MKYTHFNANPDIAHLRRVWLSAVRNHGALHPNTMDNLRTMVRAELDRTGLPCDDASIDPLVRHYAREVMVDMIRHTEFQAREDPYFLGPADKEVLNSIIEENFGHCRACGNEIFWSVLMRSDKTEGKRAPFDPTPTSDGRYQIVARDIGGWNERLVAHRSRDKGLDLYNNHFDTCTSPRTEETP